MPMNIERDPTRHLVDTGLLFELNRQVLHPLGLALVVEVDDDGASRIAGLWADPDREGIIFSPESLVEGRQKLESFMRREGLGRLATRRTALGYVVQPVPPRADGEADAPPLTFPAAAVHIPPSAWQTRIAARWAASSLGLRLDMARATERWWASPVTLIVVLLLLPTVLIAIVGRVLGLRLFF